MVTYNIKGNQNKYYDVSQIKEFKGYLIAPKDIEEHMVAQLEFYRGLKEKKLSPILIDVSDEEFKILVKVLNENYKENEIFIQSEIPICLGHSEVVSILIVNLK